MNLLIFERPVAGELREVNDLESADANGRMDVVILRRAESEKYSDAEEGSDAAMRGIALLIAGESDSAGSIFGGFTPMSLSGLRTANVHLELFSFGSYCVLDDEDAMKTVVGY